MSPKKKLALKVLALIYVGLVVLFFVHSILATKGEGLRRHLDQSLVGPETVLTEPLELRSLEGRKATQEVADALAVAGVTVIATAEDPDTVVGPSLVGKTFHAASLPAHTHLKDALWKKVLAAERDARLKAGQDITVHVAGGGSIIGFDLTLVFVIVNFLGLLVILYLLLWEPILKVLDNRAATIQKDLDGAAGDRQVAASMKEKYTGLLLGSRQERQELIAQGRKEGELERQRILETARQEADKVIAQTRAELEAAAEQARRALRQEVGDLSVELAEKILRREVRPEDNSKIVEEFLVALNDERPRN